MGIICRFLGKTARAEQKTTPPPQKAHSNDIVKRGKMGEPLEKHWKDLEKAVRDCGVSSGYDIKKSLSRLSLRCMQHRQVL